VTQFIDWVLLPAEHFHLSHFHQRHVLSCKVINPRTTLHGYIAPLTWCISWWQSKGKNISLPTLRRTPIPVLFPFSSSSSSPQSPKFVLKYPQCRSLLPPGKRQWSKLPPCTQLPALNISSSYACGQPALPPPRKSVSLMRRPAWAAANWSTIDLWRELQLCTAADPHVPISIQDGAALFIAELFFPYLLQWEVLDKWHFKCTMEVKKSTLFPSIGAVGSLPSCCPSHSTQSGRGRGDCAWLNPTGTTLKCQMLH